MPAPANVVILQGPTIKAGDSLSDALTVSSGNIFRVIMPDDWNTAILTMQISMDGTNYYDVFDEFGKEFTMPCVPNSIIPLSRYLMTIAGLKIRSGFGRSPVKQSADRVFGIVIDTRAGAVTDTLPT